MTEREQFKALIDEAHNNGKGFVCSEHLIDLVFPITQRPSIARMEQLINVSTHIEVAGCIPLSQEHAIEYFCKQNNYKITKQTIPHTTYLFERDTQ